VEEARVRFLGKKGEIKALFDELRTVDKDMKREFGRTLNELKNLAQETIDRLRDAAGEQKAAEGPQQDLSMPGDPLELGSRHPVSIVRQEIVDIFRKFGYDVAEGPELEDDYHVFEALNFPPNHPARDMQDTFFVSAGHPNPLLLRTHTSSVQVRTMERMKPPIRVICPGRVYRADEADATHSPVFHQMEGLVIDEGVTMGDLKGTLDQFAARLFGEGVSTRFRPSYFPFTEPSAEVDISCIICKGKGCPVCKRSGWLEILGCGMVDPNVLEASGIDSEKYSGFAFGMGLERIAMLKWRVNDLRHYFENDMRFLREFNTAVEV